jgi:molybdopterin/thiamine biosynthesis adenylyltransferase
MIDDSLFSRERAAGYEPEILDQMVELLIGCGALGQNILVNLALTQVGMIMSVDHDEFELHNAPRSPCFPSSTDRRRWGCNKAKVSAHAARRLVGSWSSKPRIVYAPVPIQALGDAPFRDATQVLSAVDKDGFRGRKYIGTMARKHRRVLIEGGFGGSRVNFAVLLNDRPSAPCWSCGQSEDSDDELEFGCTARARLLERAGFGPAIQPAAACLGALMTEAGIQVAHGNNGLANKRVYLDIRTGQAAIADLKKDPNCPACREWPSDIAFQVNVTSDAPCRRLLHELGNHVNDPVVTLPSRFVARAPCVQCGRAVQLFKPDWALPLEIRCLGCGGPWKVAPPNGARTSPLEVYLALSRHSTRLLELPLEQVGILAGSLIEVSSDERSLAVEVSPTSVSSPFTEAL